ncbi:MAG: PAS domain S-box protein [Proteobacteria bacterium]|nr:PAS domain S-box protein [Pseudomonadota bacterium]
MPRKTNTDRLIQRMRDLENELANLKRVTSNIHSSYLYNEEIGFFNHDPLLDLISDGITVLDQSGIILYVNDSAAIIFDHPSEELVGKAIVDYVSSVGADTEFLDSLYKSFEEEPPKSGEYIVNFSDHRKAMVHLTFTMKNDPLSGANHLWIITRDLTKEKQLEDELKSSRERLDRLIENLPDLVVNVDLNGCILFINPQTKQEETDEIIGTSIYDYILPEDHERIREKMALVFDSGEEAIYDSSWISSDGIVRWFTTRAIPIKHDSQVIAATLTARDSSDKKKTEEELKNSQNMLESVLQSIPGTLVVLDKKYNILASNWHGLKKHQSKHPDAKNKCHELYWHRDKPCKECYARKVFESGKPIRTEIFNKNDNGYKEIRVYPVLNDLGAVRYVIEHIQDITQRKQSEEKMLIAKLKTEAAQQLKTDFLSKVSHELKTPMIGILGFSKLGVERYKKVTKEKLKSYFTTILESGEKLQILLNNLVDLSQLEVGNIDYDFQNEKLSMVTTIILNEMFTLLNENRIAVDFHKPDFSDLVHIDVDRIGKVIRNLITNAVKFSKPDTSITLDISRHKDQILFSVVDTGDGIPENELELIFEKFIQSSRTKSNSDGRGLGLAISKQIVTDHKGEIWAENHPKGGSAFKFVLPVSSETSVG